MRHNNETDWGRSRVSLLVLRVTMSVVVVEGGEYRHYFSFHGHLRLSLSRERETDVDPKVGLTIMGLIPRKV